MKHTLTWRRTAAAAVLPLALAGFTACGGDDAEKANDTSSASEQLEESAEVEDSDLVAGDEVPNKEFVELMTSFLDEATTARTTMTSENSGVQMTGEGVVDYASASPAMQMSVQSEALGEGAMDMILIDNVMYMQMPDLGEKYVAIDFDDPDNPFGTMMADSMDPSKQAELMTAGLRSVTFTGEEDVDGESMERYAAVVDPTAVLKGMDGFKDMPQDMLPKEMSYDVWFDDEGQMRRMNIGMGDLGDTEMTLDDWGADVSVEAPPADQVTTMADMMGSMG